MQKEKSTEKFSRTYREIGPYLGLGTQLAATVIILFFVGYWLDERFSLFPLLTIIFSFLGGIVGIYNFIKTVIVLNDKKKNRKDL
ncbi:MAG: hypothetical protein A2V66_17055 [Ignavibacteria bacterium RBG_13_36_8]|nr:MAG: hypothetical protein A2V66_17055 [Ignavibacteria bacterium RBG_13_36_8]